MFTYVEGLALRRSFSVASVILTTFVPELRTVTA
jgi:hypothetical protein